MVAVVCICLISFFLTLSANADCDRNMIGLYPLTSQTTFLVHAPWFPMTIDLGDGKELAITTTGGNSDTAYYVQSLEVNGKAWNKAWVTWEDVFADGGAIDFVLGPEPSDWSKDGDLPPSPGSSLANSVTSESCRFYWSFPLAFGLYQAYTHLVAI